MPFPVNNPSLALYWLLTGRLFWTPYFLSEIMQWTLLNLISFIQFYVYEFQPYYLMKLCNISIKCCLLFLFYLCAIIHLSILFMTTYS
jgi:hypothetical protein